MGRTGGLGRLHCLTEVLYGRRVDRSGPIWPPDELLGDDHRNTGAGSAAGDRDIIDAVVIEERPSGVVTLAPEYEPIAPVWLDAGGPTPRNPDDDVRLTPEDWLSDDTGLDGAGGGTRAFATDDAGSVPVPTVVSPWAAPPRAVRERAARDAPATEPAQPVPAGPLLVRERVIVEEPPPTEQPVPIEPTGPAAGVYDVPGPRSALSMHQITVVCRNANAGRAVSRLLTITLQHADVAAWDRAADMIRADSDFSHAGDMLARDQALTVIDAGPDVRAAPWERAVDAADQLVVAVNAAGTGPAEAVALIDALGRSRHADLARRAVTVVLLPVSRLGLTRGHEDVAAIRRRFTERCHAVFLAPFDLRPTAASRNVWREIAETVRAGLPLS